MERFFIDIRNGSGYTPDAEGQMLPDLGAAREEAIAGIRSILSEEIREGKIDLRGRAEIRGSGGVLLTVPFSDAFQLHLERENPS